MTRHVLVAALALAACADPPPGRSGRVEQAILHGTVSSAAQDHVVLIAIPKAGKVIPLCTGTLVAKNLVLTARHCIGDLTADEATVVDYSPATLKVYVGVDAGPRTVDGEPAAQGSRIVHAATPAVDPDVALLVLDRALDAPIAPLRLARGVTAGEALDLVGYGLTQENRYPRTRQHRAAKVARVGPAKSTFFDVAAGEFQLGEAACAGDSGGPALSAETGAVVGVASRISNGETPSDAVPAGFCAGAEDVYVEPATTKDLIAEGFAAAGAEPWLEGEPPPSANASSATAREDDSGCATARGPRPSDLALALALVACVVARARRELGTRNMNANQE